MPLPNVDICDLIPHRDGMKLIDTILAVDEHRAVTRSVVSERWPLVEDGCASPILLVELVAQTAGVNNGWARIKKKGLHSEKKGWLVGIKRAVIDRWEPDITLPEASPLRYAPRRQQAHPRFRTSGLRCGPIPARALA